jgi:hypothetical protein
MQNIYLNQTIQLEKFASEVLQVQRSNRRELILQYLDELRKEIDAQFNQVGWKEAGDSIFPRFRHRTSGKVRIIPETGVQVSISPMIGQVQTYILDRGQFTEFLDAIRKRISSESIDIELEPKKLVTFIWLKNASDVTSRSRQLNIHAN